MLIRKGLASRSFSEGWAIKPKKNRGSSYETKLVVKTSGPSSPRLGGFASHSFSDGWK